MRTLLILVILLAVEPAFTQPTSYEVLSMATEFDMDNPKFNNVRDADMIITFSDSYLIFNNHVHIKLLSNADERNSTDYTHFKFNGYNENIDQFVTVLFSIKKQADTFTIFLEYSDRILAYTCSKN